MAFDVRVLVSSRPLRLLALSWNDTRDELIGSAHFPSALTLYTALACWNSRAVGLSDWRVVSIVSKKFLFFILLFSIVEAS